MEKYIVTIEETMDKDFEVLASNAEEALKIAKKKYKSCVFVVDNSNVTFRQMTVRRSNDEMKDWVTF